MHMCHCGQWQALEGYVRHELYVRAWVVLERQLAVNPLKLVILHISRYSQDRVQIDFGRLRLPFLRFVH